MIINESNSKICKKKKNQIKRCTFQKYNNVYGYYISKS